ncbi:mitochondrial rho GTPase 1 [Blastocystis sp. subtype 4]|uniref:mitochondrial rho GTPase 1 n=1 Tax=Blastocystis sp. subtype 4 TaxID=944170 RepID=UPI00071181FB|nr:mitochondrial rho GTPase 1 [Blastocystis sp. subtype 4]KNB45700.1 mitochondrial rho GTPase 1 [Blastocystis sp. subtype 4]|eukprot:XP_014529143.1 mitochondrial rho GTPase 1 [Blastocystis sp. subtype 4]
MKNQVRTVFLGDPHCGKTSIINTINTNEFQEGLPDVIEEVAIPNEFTISHVPLFLDDSSVSESVERADLIRLADAIVVVIDASNEASYDSLFSNWMPSILKVSPSVGEDRIDNVQKPVLVVANKVDLIEEDEQNLKLEQVLNRVLSEYLSVEVCLKCSAKTAMNLDKVLYYAEKSVIFPIAPLYDRATHMLQEPLKCILRRIFRVFNRSRTLALSDEELNEFQVHYSCFNTRMSASEITNLKRVLLQQGGESCIDIATNGITEEGFIHLMQLFVMKEHTETVWMALRYCGYSDDLELDMEIPVFDLKKDQSVEFTAEARIFLTSLFKAYDREKSGVLTQEGLSRVFAPVLGNKPLWVSLAAEKRE